MQEHNKICVTSQYFVNGNCNLQEISNKMFVFNIICKMICKL